MNGSMVAI